MTAPTISGKYVSVTTFKPDGSGVATPVWFVEEAGRLLIDTGGTSYKVKRIRANPLVTIAACSARGRVRGDSTAGHAQVLPVTDVVHVEELLARKYRFEMVFLRPIRWIQTTMHLGRARGESVIVAIKPD
jgi:PPOX class probable F420-dependent enzyme